MQRQLRLGDILDDYCPRERRVTNHAIVAMLGSDIKQTRCTTCDAEHEYRQARVPRQRRKADTPAALYAAVLSGGPKRVPHGSDQATRPDDHDDSVGAPAENSGDESAAPDDEMAAPRAAATARASAAAESEGDEAIERDDDGSAGRDVEGPVHRPLIRASLPRPEGTPPPQRPAPDFTIRQPGGRPPNRFRGRHQRGGPQFQGQGGNRGNGNMGGPSRGGMMRHGGGGRPQGNAPGRPGHRNGPGRKRQK